MREDKKPVVIYDQGLFVEIAPVLARRFGKVYYYSPWASAEARSNAMLVGYGLPGVERIDAWQPYAEEGALFVFPDIYDGPLQELLEERLGVRVWGSRMAEDLELDRLLAKQVYKAVNLNVGKYKIAPGLEALRDLLKDEDDRYVKLSFTRGDMETFHSPNYAAVEPRLNELAMVMGPWAHHKTFIVEEPIPDAVEIGIDAYTIDGQFPSKAMVGIEAKSKAYIGRFMDWKDIPKELSRVHEELAEYLEYTHCRNFFTVETRITEDGRAYPLDACVRFANPPGYLAMEMYENLADIIDRGADGEMVEPEPKAEWGVEIKLVSAWATKHHQPITFPKKYERNLRFSFCARIPTEDQPEDKITVYVLPQLAERDVIGSAIGWGDTPEEAADMAREAAAAMDSYGIDVMDDGVYDAAEEWQKAIDWGLLEAPNYG